jgi:hypothetical protein
MMMQSFDAPDIRYKTLTSEGMAHGEGEDHPPYTDETIKRTITQGVDPAGNPLKWLEYERRRPERFAGLSQELAVMRADLRVSTVAHR